MIRLESYYERHPFPFFIVHMAAIVALLVALISGVMLQFAAQAGTTVRAVHGISSAVLFVLFVIGAAEALVVKIGSIGKDNPGYRPKRVDG